MRRNKMSTADYPRVHATTAAEWRRWLRDNHDKVRGVWLVAYKAVTGKARLSYEDSIPDALCYGWIDSVNKPLDDERTALLFTPRKAGSGWSRSNKVRIARLLKERRMEAAGLAKIAAAKRDGSWTLLDSVEALEVPDDLRKKRSASRVCGRSTRLRPAARRNTCALSSQRRGRRHARSASP
jgi:uncharacterized protein YdeI (YjbR/CyaY-like superfamily)